MKFFVVIVTLIEIHGFFSEHFHNSRGSIFLISFVLLSHLAAIFIICYEGANNTKEYKWFILLEWKGNFAR